MKNENRIPIQYTLFCTTGKYKPVSCIVEIENVKHFNEDPDFYKRKAIEKICLKRYWKTADLTRYGYTKIKCRIYRKSEDQGLTNSQPHDTMNT